MRSVIRRLLPILLGIFLAMPVAAATLSVDVRDARGTPLDDAVVYAIAEGREAPLAKRTAVMDQKNRMFVPRVLPVQTGTAVQFPNSDDIQHQVYSFSPAKTFQLPLYKGMPSNPIVFDKAGVATLGCNIHDRMTAYIVVVDTPHFGATGKDGHVSLAQLPAGRYAVHVWHPQRKAEPVTVTLTSTEQRELRVLLR